MKAVHLNISLNPELAEFARTDALEAAFNNMSEYMRELIRRRREERIAEDLATLEKAIAGAPCGDPSVAKMREIYAAIKKGRKNECGVRRRGGRFRRGPGEVNRICAR